MTRSKLFFKILFVCLLFASCENEPYEGDLFTDDIVNDDGSDDDGNNDDNGGNDDDDPDEQALLVSKISIQREGNPEVFTTDFTYDSENRLVREEDSEGYFLNYNYENGKLAGTNSSNGIDNSEDILEYYFYDSQGRVDAVTIDIQEVPNPYTINYNYNSDSTIIEGIRSLTGQLQERQSYSFNGNIFLLEEFDADGITSESFIYDNMNGAFKNIAMRETIATINSENLPSSLLYFGLNNPTSRELRVNAILSQTLTFTYIYNDEGYPISVTEVFTSDGVTETSIYTLTYITAH